jgi:hypothetical protein
MTMATETTTTTGTVEYRVERLPVADHPELHLAEILDCLNDFGKDGWRVASIDLTYRTGTQPKGEKAPPIAVLLERPVAWKRPVEYRIERIPFQDHPEPRFADLIDRLVELDQQGWRVISVDLIYHPPRYKPGSPWALYGLDNKYTMPLDTDLVREAEVQVPADPVPVLLAREI